LPAFQFVFELTFEPSQHEQSSYCFI